MLLCIEYGILFVNTINMKIKAHNALNAMFVKTVDTVCTGVCGSYTIPYTEYYEVWKLASCLLGGKAICIWKAFHLGGLAVHKSVRGGSFVNFLGLVKL